MFKLSNKKRIYLDHAATTYLDKEVFKAMQPFWSEDFGNPSSIYEDGMKAKFAVDQARKNIASVFKCKDSEIVFTAGGTESVNLAIFGVVRNALKTLNGNKKPHIICSAIEHHSVLESFKALEGEGVEITYLKVNSEGFVNLKELEAAIKPNTLLISIIYANNEVGTIQPISEIGKFIKKINDARFKKNLERIIFHTDACQAVGSLETDVNKLNVDLLSFNGSKIYGPKQIGGLFVRYGTKLTPLIYGGGQENSLRSGTENVPAIVGLAKAMQLAAKNKAKENKRLRELRNYFLKQVQKNIPNALLNGADVKNDSEKNPVRLPNNINLSIVGAEGEALMLYLNAKGIEISTGSACTSTSMDPSHVIKALGRNEADARAAIRITLGKITTKKDLDFVLKVMPGIVKELRRVTQLSYNQN